MLSLNLIVNCVTLISSLLLITGAIRVSHAHEQIDLDSESGLINDELSYFFVAQLDVCFPMADLRGRMSCFLIPRRCFKKF